MNAWLVVLSGEAKPNSIQLIPTQIVSLGRMRNNTIIIKDEHASRHHAEIYEEDGTWMIRDLGTTNGTYLDHLRLSCPMALSNRQIIRVGGVSLQFLFADAHPVPSTTEVAVRQEGGKLVIEPEQPPEPPVEESDSTILQPDELTELWRFLSSSYSDPHPRGLINLAIRAIVRQLAPTVCGFLNLDPDGPLAHQVWPLGAVIEQTLSKRLTEKVRGTQKLVWLAQSDHHDLEGESLACYQDALCVPLNVSGAQREEPPLGALHVYRSHRSFTEREVFFVELIAGSLANCLLASRTQRSLKAENRRLQISAPGGGSTLVGESARMEKIRQEILALADCPSSVLFTGETGAGKEVAAMMLHKHSPRRHAPFVEVNCATLEPNLADALLCGHAKGAFTGAGDEKEGYFQQADGGTLFLDEVGDLPPETQNKLLRILETRKVRPVMGKEEQYVDVRIIAATERDLNADVREGRFRQALKTRLGLEIRIPPLREHAEDIPELAQHLLDKLNAQYQRQAQLTRKAVEKLCSYHWPANVRELRLVLERAVALNRTGFIDADNLTLDEQTSLPVVVVDQEACYDLGEIEKQTILRALVCTDGNKTKAAQLLGITRGTLIEMLKKMCK
jgi:DNA-binding NtrC family response regulator